LRFAICVFLHSTQEDKLERNKIKAAKEKSRRYVYLFKFQLN